MPASISSNVSIFFSLLVVFLSRLFFINQGFGSEEDAWGLILTARSIAQSGVYEVSRMPGHPLQEWLLSLIWYWPAWLLNLLTAIASTAGILFFMLALRRWGIPNFILAGLLMAFVPVYYINSTNIMDYTWAVSLIMAAMYFLSAGNILLSGVLIGLATGFRITAGAMVLPFALWLLFQPRALRNVMVLGLSATVTGVICFIPAFMVYGSRFFTYYQYFPYPPVLKNIYKATIGPFGIIGLTGILTGISIGVLRWGRMAGDLKKKYLPFILVALLTIALYTVSFIKLPQKAAFVIPVIPFIAMLLAMMLTRFQMTVMAALQVLSCFFLGINLDDHIRGSERSRLAVRTVIGDSPVAVDPLNGLVPADYSKRKQKIRYAKSIVDKMRQVKDKTVIVAGWWQNELNYFSLEKPNSHVIYVYYIDEHELKDYKQSGWRIFYLPEQDYWNDVRFNMQQTRNFAVALPE